MLLDERRNRSVFPVRRHHAGRHAAGKPHLPFHHVPYQYPGVSQSQLKANPERTTTRAHYGFIARGIATGYHNRRNLYVWMRKPA